MENLGYKQYRIEYLLVQ